MAKAGPNIEASVAQLLMQNEQLVADCRQKKARIDALRRQRGGYVHALLYVRVCCVRMFFCCLCVRGHVCF